MCDGVRQAVSSRYFVLTITYWKSASFLLGDTVYPDARRRRIFFLVEILNRNCSTSGSGPPPTSPLQDRLSGGKTTLLHK